MKREPSSLPIARDSRGAVLQSQFSKHPSWRTYALQRDANADALKPRRFSWQEDQP